MQNRVIRNPDYKLTANLLSRETQQQQLIVKLTTKYRDKYQFYQQRLTQKNFLCKADSFFRSVGLSGIFDCFQDNEHFQINFGDGKQIQGQNNRKQAQIRLKIPFQIRKMAHTWQGSIKLLRKQVSDSQILSQQVQQLKNEVLELKKRTIQKQSDDNIQKLQHQNNQLRNQNDILKKQNQALVMQLLKFKGQIKAIEQQYKTKLINLNSKFEKLFRHSKRMEDQFKNKNSMVENCGRKLKANEFKNNQIETQQIRYNKNKERYLQRQKNKQKNTLHQFLKFCSVDPQNYQIRNKQIQLLHKKQSLFYINQKIPTNQDYEASIQIVETASRNIMIGVADPNLVNHQKLDTNLFPYYWGRNGMILGENRIEGDGFKEGDTVKISVDMKKNWIEWAVNGQMSASCGIKVHQQSKQQMILYPCIIIEDEGDTIKWLNSSSSKN